MVLKIVHLLFTKQHQLQSLKLQSVSHQFYKSILITKNVFLPILIEVFLICELITANDFWHWLISQVFPSQTEWH